MVSSGNVITPLCNEMIRISCVRLYFFIASFLESWMTSLCSHFCGCTCVTGCPISGYCGADLKSLCTEAALHALRRRYPQIYQTNQKLQLDVTSINLIAKDFHRATQAIVPAAQRAVTSPARCLVPAIRPLLQSSLDKCIRVLATIFPQPPQPHSHTAKPCKFQPSPHCQTIYNVGISLLLTATLPNHVSATLPSQKHGQTIYQ